MMVTEWIPAIVVVDINVGDKCWLPPATIVIEGTPWTPRPITTVENPTAIVVRRPSPGFITNPRPTIRRAPDPMSITIRRPIIVNIDYRIVRTPNPTVVRCIAPITKGIEIFCAPNVFVVVLNVVTESLCEIALPIIYPVIDWIERRIGNKLPVARVVARDY